MKQDMTKITINIGIDLLNKIEAYAKTLSINRTSAMCVLMSQALEQKEMINVLDRAMEVAKNKK